MFLAIYDQQCRTSFISQTIDGYSQEDVVGSLPWDLFENGESKYYWKEKMIELCQGKKRVSRWGRTWVKPGDKNESRYFLACGHYLALSPKSWVSVVMWDFCKEFESLTPTHLKVLRHLGGGYSVKEIASKMKRSPNTIHHHLKVIRERLGLVGIESTAAMAAKYRLTFSGSFCIPP